MANTFDVPPGARLRVLAVSGKVRVIGEDRTDIELEPSDRRAHVVDEGRVVETKSHSGDVLVRVPEWMDVSVGTVSGPVRINGTVRNVKSSTVSGDVAIEYASGDVTVRSITGSIRVMECGGRCRAVTKDGRLELPDG